MPFYRVTVDGVGIYEAVDRDCSKGDPRRVNKPDGSWLPKKGLDYPGAISYWTEAGWKKYQESGLYDWHKSVVDGPVTVETLAEKPQTVFHEDDLQIIVPSGRASRIG